MGNREGCAVNCVLKSVQYSAYTNEVSDITRVGEWVEQYCICIYCTSELSEIPKVEKWGEGRAVKWILDFTVHLLPSYPRYRGFEKSRKPSSLKMISEKH